MKAREYMREMNTKQKISYIWYYYKIHIIVAVILIAALGMFISERINSKDYVFNFTVIGNNIDLNAQDNMEKEADILLLGKANGKEQVMLDFLSESKNANGGADLEPVMQQKLIVNLSIGEINVMALDKRLFNQLAAQDTFAKLSDLKGLELGNAKVVKANSQTGTEDIYGIEMEGNTKLKNIGYDTENKVLCVIANNKKPDMAVKFVNWLLK